MPKNSDLGADADRVRKEEQLRIDEAEQLSEEELAEKEDLLREVGCVLFALQLLCEALILFSVKLWFNNLWLIFNNVLCCWLIGVSFFVCVLRLRLFLCV